MTNRPICDFCSDPHPVTAFPLTIKKPAWVACADCATLIRAGQSMALAEQTARKFSSEHAVPYGIILPYAVQTQRLFWRFYAYDQPEVPLP